MIYDYSALANYQPEESVIYVVRRFGSLWFRSLSEELARGKILGELERFCNPLACVVCQGIFKQPERVLVGSARSYRTCLAIVGVRSFRND